MTAEIIFERRAALAVLTFNRPEFRNAMTWAMYEGLVTACDAVDAEEELRVLILRGAGGKAFVAGTDIGQFQTFRSPEDALDYERRMDRIIGRLEMVTKPTIAAIAGVAAGGGASTALACDLRYCTPESAIGVPIAGGGARDRQLRPDHAARDQGGDSPAPGPPPGSRVRRPHRPGVHERGLPRRRHRLPGKTHAGLPRAVAPGRPARQDSANLY